MIGVMSGDCEMGVRGGGGWKLRANRGWGRGIMVFCDIIIECEEKGKWKDLVCGGGIRVELGGSGNRLRRKL